MVEPAPPCGLDAAAGAVGSGATPHPLPESCSASSTHPSSSAHEVLIEKENRPVSSASLSVEEMVSSPHKQPASGGRRVDTTATAATATVTAEGVPPWRPSQTRSPSRSRSPRRKPSLMLARRMSLSVSASTVSSSCVDVGAPGVWTAPDWAAHPVIECYYGEPRRPRDNSFVDVMRSPLNTEATRMLAELCNGYDRSSDDDDDDDGDDDGHTQGDHRDVEMAIREQKRAAAAMTMTTATATAPARPASADASMRMRRGMPPPVMHRLGDASEWRGTDGYAQSWPRQARAYSAAATSSAALLTDAGGVGRRRKLGSFSYSLSTENSDDAGPSPFSASMMESGFGARHLKGMGTRYDRDDDDDEEMLLHAMGAAEDHHRPPLSANGYATWNRRRQQQNATTEMVPIPMLSTLGKKPSNVQDDAKVHERQAENPQCGHGSTLARKRGDRGTRLSSPPPRHPLTSARLRTKLHECVHEIDARIYVERELASEAYSKLTYAKKPRRESVVWALLCGARMSSTVTHSDGSSFLHERLCVALHHRALNQLQRHRRHVRGILQIVTSHNPDLSLTEKQLDSFESAHVMLANDIKYSTLQKQVGVLGVNLTKRKEALRDAKLKNGLDCFESSRVKSVMLSKLLEAVSWYRLVQTNTREESASSTVGAPVMGSSGTSEDAQSLSSSSSPGSSTSLASAARSLQELQVERILNVLAGEDFYSEYSELMCQPDWWEIAQAHFENLIFARADSRISQWISRISRDVAIVCSEPLEGQEAYVGKMDEKKASLRARERLQKPAEWTKDPQPEQILEFIDRLTRRIRQEFDVANEVSKSLHCFIQRTVFPRLGTLCYNQKAMIDCQRKDKLWRKRCSDLSGITMESLTVSSDLAEKFRFKLPSRRVAGGVSYLIRAIDAFNCMSSVVPCDLLDELMYGVIILHHEAAVVLGTTQFSVETFFPLLAYVLLHCHLPTIHAQLHLLENFAITHANVNGEESYYVYCVHAAVEYVCNSAGLVAEVTSTSKLKAAVVANTGKQAIETKPQAAKPAAGDCTVSISRRHSS